MTSLPSLNSFRRIVVKVGSSLLVDQTRGVVKRAWLEALADNLAELRRDKRDVLVVSSVPTPAESGRGSYTLIVTAKFNDIDPQACLADVLAHIADHSV